MPWDFSLVEDYFLIFRTGCFLWVNDFVLSCGDPCSLSTGGQGRLLVGPMFLYVVRSKFLPVMVNYKFLVVLKVKLRNQERKPLYDKVFMPSWCVVHLCIKWNKFCPRIECQFLFLSSLQTATNNISLRL